MAKIKPGARFNEFGIYTLVEHEFIKVCFSIAAAVFSEKKPDQSTNIPCR